MKRKITVNTFGTRSDIQPYIALSLGLQQAGHTVRIVTHQIYEPFVKEYGLDFYPLHLDPRQVLLNQALSELGNDTFRITRWMEESFQTTSQGPSSRRQIAPSSHCGVRSALDRQGGERGRDK
jgi:hypothetical protein